MVKFEGPFPLNANFNPVAGVYVIGDTLNKVIDVGQTGNLQQRMACHDREECWKRNGAIKLWFVHINDTSLRLDVEASLRQQHAPACGIR